ncbi:MAG: ribonuclease HII [Clostridiales Family XIII bacterium]|jgi:ribonuclease HII|nr:ribonuclease HII [Clostridiales Family XIII bacterium]
MNKIEREEMLKEKLLAMLSYENALFDKGLHFIGGVDEVGRGPLAGPVAAACVVLPAGFSVIGIDDSKKLSAKRRKEMFAVIVSEALAYGVGMVSPQVIDEVNILNATKMAMADAVRAADGMLAERTAPEEKRIEHLLVDGVALPEASIHGTAITKGDTKSVSIAAASIVAKVVRDRLMDELDSIYPGYAFARNKGYGTELHYAGLRKLGPSPVHRKTFLKNF